MQVILLEMFNFNLFLLFDINGILFEGYVKSFLINDNKKNKETINYTLKKFHHVTLHINIKEKLSIRSTLVDAFIYLCLFTDLVTISRVDKRDRNSLM